MMRYNLGYKCCFCRQPIPDDDIPKKCKSKIGLQLVWHEECA